MLACLAATIGMVPDLLLSFMTDENTDHLVTLPLVTLPLGNESDNIGVADTTYSFADC